MCESVIWSLQEAERHLQKGTTLETRLLANLCCSDALIGLGHFTEMRCLRDGAPFWDVQILRIVAKGIASDTLLDTPYDPKWSVDYRGRPPFLGDPQDG